MVSAQDPFCDNVCHRIRDPYSTGSLGETIEKSFSQGNDDILLGRKITEGLCGHESSTIWNLWAKGIEGSFPSEIIHRGESERAEDRVCIDKVTLAKLTAATSRCHSTIHVSGGESASKVRHSDTQVEGNDGMDDATVRIGTTTLPGFGGESTGISLSNDDDAITSKRSTSSSSRSESGWGTGNVDTSKLCFKIKDKRSDRYLTTYGSEYAFAYYPNYYSIFRAHPSRSVEGGYTLDEVNRNGGAVNYPVKINSQLNSFKPLYGDKDAVFTFNPASFGDSCWGVPEKKMSRRHDWSGWGDNYRFASSGDDCADVELEEAAC